jgi:hypothetical protein
MDRPLKPPAPPVPAYASSADVVAIERIAFEHGFVVVWARLADGRRGLWDHELGAKPGSQDRRFRILPGIPT